MSILICEPHGYPEEARAVLATLGGVEAGPLTRSELISRISRHDVLVVRLAHEIDREVFESAPRLRIVATATTGLDHIDLSCASERGVKVLSLAGESAFLRTVSATAEHTWALLLALYRRIPAASESVRRGLWDRDAFIGRDLAHKSLGIVGFGRIGQMVARYGLAFGMEVKACDPDWGCEIDGVQRVHGLEALLSQSDVVTLHVPFSESTRGMIGNAQFAAMRDHAVLINTSRGGVVDEAALLDALRSGRLAGAGLDVIQHERDTARRAGSALLSYAAMNENLLITPHIGGATIDAMRRAEVFMAQKIAREFSPNGESQ